jgi:hypothetical protein
MLYAIYLVKQKNSSLNKGRVYSRFHPNYSNPHKMYYYHSIPLTLASGYTYLGSALNSEVVFNNTCSRNLSADEFLSLLTANYLLFLFIVFTLLLLYDCCILMSTLIFIYLFSYFFNCKDNRDCNNNGYNGFRHTVYYSYAIDSFSSYRRIYTFSSSKFNCI